MSNAIDQKHRYGQHYTPHEVARLLAAFAVRLPGDIVLDPACGDGRLLAAALNLKKQFYNRHLSAGSSSSDQVFGVERSATAVKAAHRTGAGVAAANFFDVAPGAALNRSIILPREFDAVIGNPPYIRQEVIGQKGKRHIEARLARDRAASPGVFWPRWSGRSDIYVYFFAHSIGFLKEHGRLVFLTASSWLDAGYGAPLRDFLLANFRIIAVIESGIESFFEDASINTAITVLEREPGSGARAQNQIRFIRFNRRLIEILGKDWSKKADAAVELAKEIEHAQASSRDERYRVRVIAQSELLMTTTEPGLTARAAVQPGWGKYLRADDIFFKVIDRGSSRLRNLSKMASVRFGVKTGANEFFYVTGEQQRSKGKARRAKGERPALRALSDVAAVRRGITTGANEFFYLSRAVSPTSNERTRNAGRPEKGSSNGRTIVSDFAGNLREIESTLLSPVIFSLKQVRGVLLERVESQRMLFNCSLTEHELSGTCALDYIKSGEHKGYDRRPSCSSRDPWYSVARRMRPAPLIFPSKVGERWVVALNRAGVFEDKKLYGIFPGDGVSEETLWALLNSTWARYYAEITCRQMTGAQAIADIDVAVAEQIMIPDPRDLSPTLSKKLEAAIAELSRRDVYSIFEEVTRADRRRLDALALEAIGFDKKAEREDVLDQLYRAVTELVRARLAKAHTNEIQKGALKAHSGVPSLQESIRFF